MKHLISFVLALLAVCLPATAQLRFTKIVTNVMDLRALDTRDIHKAIYVRGFTTSGDGGEGIFVADEASIEPHFPGMVETNIGPGRFIRHFDRPEFPATWFGTPVDNSVLNSAISWASSNGFGYVIMPLGDTAVDPITNAVTLKDNVSLIWPPGANWVVDHVPATNWTLLSVVGVTNFGLFAPSMAGVTNIPGDIANFGRLITILSSTNGFILDPKLEAEYSDAIYWGDDLSTNANQNITVSGANQTVMDANPGTRLAADLNYRRVTNLVELSLSDVSKQNLLMEVYSQSDTNITGFWQYDPDNADVTNATDTVSLVNFSGRFKKIASFGTGGGGGGIAGTLIGTLTPPHLPYATSSTNLADSSLIQVDATNVLSLGNLSVTNGQFGAWSDGSALRPAYSLNGLGTGYGLFRDVNGSPAIAGAGVSRARFSNTSLRIPGGYFFAWCVGDPETTVVRQGLYQGTGSPEGVVSANVGSAYFDYGTGNQYLKKGGGSGNTGWVIVGITINPTDNFFPVRSNSTTFVDSPLKKGEIDKTVELVAFESAVTNYSRLSFSVQTNLNLSIIKPEYGGSGTNFLTDLRIYFDSDDSVIDFVGTGSPEGAVVSGVGSTYRRRDGGAGSSFYVKESGTGNTGWQAK